MAQASKALPLASKHEPQKLGLFNIARDCSSLLAILSCQVALKCYGNLENMRISAIFCFIIPYFIIPMYS